MQILISSLGCPSGLQGCARLRAPFTASSRSTTGTAMSYDVGRFSSAHLKTIDVRRHADDPVLWRVSPGLLWLVQELVREANVPIRTVVLAGADNHWAHVLSLTEVDCPHATAVQHP